MSDNEKALAEFVALAPSREGEHPEQYRARSRFLYRLADWTEPRADIQAAVEPCEVGES